MQIYGLTKENVEFFTDYLTADVAENIGRSFTCGFVVTEDPEEPSDADKPSDAEAIAEEETQYVETEAIAEDDISYANATPIAAIVWELCQGENDLDVVSRILFVKAKDEEAADILMQEYTELAVKMECISSSFDLPKTLGSVEKKALEKAGFSLEESEGDVICVALADFGMALALGDKADDEVKPLSEAEERAFDNAITRLDDDGKRGIYEDMPYLPKDFFDNSISCYMEDDDLISALVLFHRRPSGKIDLALVEVLDEYEIDIKRLLRQSVLLSEDLYEPGARYFIDRSDASLNELSKELFPKAKGIQVISGFRKEELPEEPENEEMEDEDLYDEELEYDDL